VTAAVPCTRRWYATYTGCKCAPCKRRNRLAVKLVEAGHDPAIARRAAIAVLRRLMARDWTDTAIASACGLAQDTAHGILMSIRAGRPRRITAGVALRILNHGEPTSGYVSAVPATRKLRALARIGHSLPAIAEAADQHRTTLNNVRLREPRWISPQVARDIDKAWRALCMTIGDSAVTRGLAEAQGWPGPLAWDDIEDLNERPKGMPAERTRAALHAVVDAVLDEGLNLADAARKAGVDVKTVRRARDRRREGRAA
jgi:lambda repressor-like predicted transcriptional regulator